MRRILQVFVLSMVIGASVAGVASAAGSPAVATGGATKIGNASAVLNGTVNPNGHATQYDFTYGPTTAYGVTTTLHTVKAGTKAVAVSDHDHRPDAGDALPLPHHRDQPRWRRGRR